MKYLIKYLLSICISICLMCYTISALNTDETTEWLKLLNLPKPTDTLSTSGQTCQLTAQTLADQLTKNSGNGLVLITKSSSTGKSCADDSSSLATQSAQLLASRNITVCELTISGQKATALGIAEDSVLVYLNGKQHVYYGRRSPSALLSYVLKLSTSNLRLITGKMDKIAYDLVAAPKIVGFFMPATPDLMAYETVAAKYSPDIPFYLVADRLVAKYLKLTTVGQINLIRPFEKQPVICSINPATAVDIEMFIEKNKGIALKYVTEHNVFDPNLQTPDKTTVIAISDRSSAAGHYFHKLFTKTIRNITNENTVSQTLNDTPLQKQQSAEPIVELPVSSIVNLDSIEIIWIEPQMFPSINLIVDQLQILYGLPSGDTYLGAVNRQTNQTVWFDTNQLNSTGGKLAEEANQHLLKQWITDVVANLTIAVASDQSTGSQTNEESTGVQTFVKEPQSVAVSEGQSFVIECEVSDKVGDCLWLKDGRNIGLNVARVSIDYSLRQSTIGDCSLVVAKALPDRDNGKWVCEVTGDQTNPTLTSPAATVTVVPEPKNEL